MVTSSLSGVDFMTCDLQYGALTLPFTISLSSNTLSSVIKEYLTC